MEMDRQLAKGEVGKTDKQAIRENPPSLPLSLLSGRFSHQSLLQHTFPSKVPAALLLMQSLGRLVYQVATDVCISAVTS